MKNFLSLLLLYYGANCYSQEKFSDQYGIGIIAFNFDEYDTNKKLFFYEKTGDYDPAKIVEFSSDIKKDIKKYKDWFMPEELIFNYGKIQFFCLEEKDNWFKVVVNHQTGKAYWIKKNAKTSFHGWEQCLTENAVIKRMNAPLNPIHKSPNEKSDVINYADTDCFKGLRIKDQWIEITPTQTEDCLALPDFKSGWIKWRNESGMLIRYVAQP